MTTTEHRAGNPLYSWFLASGLLAGTRAVLIALRDGYFATGFEGLAVSSFARHYAEGLAVSLAVALLARFLWVRSESGFRALLFGLVVCVGYAFASGRLPDLPFHKPGFEGSAALAAHAIALLTAVVATFVLVRASLRATRTGLVLAWLAVATGVLGPPLANLAHRRTSSIDEHPNVILISLDTVRTDHLSCYGYERETTPRIDQFAQQSLRFTQANAPHPWTLTSHMSMLTGLLPSEHGVAENKRLPSSIPTLAELYASAGYDTLALVDRVVWLDERYGFERGFASYRRVYGSAAEKIAMLETVFDDLRDGPFFLFLHYFDAHSDAGGLPYESASRDFEELCGWYDGAFSGCVDDHVCGSKLLKALNRKEVSVEPEVERLIRDLYDAGLMTLDRDLGLLFDLLAARGCFENSIIVLTSDHGEELRDHGQYLHGTHFQECVSVPLFVRMPGGAQTETSDVLVSHVDLAATLLDLSGLDRSEVGGRSYAPLVARGIDTKRRNHILFDAGELNLGVRLGDWKLISNAGEFLLFDLASDPLETRNLIETDPAPGELTVLQSILAAEYERLRARQANSEGESRDVSLTEEQRQELGNVGYAGDE